MVCINLKATKDPTVLKQFPFCVDKYVVQFLGSGTIFGETGQPMYVLTLKPGTADSVGASELSYLIFGAFFALGTGESSRPIRQPLIHCVKSCITAHVLQSTFQNTNRLNGRSSGKSRLLKSSGKTPTGSNNFN